MNAKQFAEGRKQLIEKFGRMLADGETPAEYTKALAPLAKYAKVRDEKLTATIIGDWIAANPDWKAPKKFQPADASVYGVFWDYERRTCIRVGTGRKWTEFIPMDTVLAVRKLENKEFGRRFTPITDYPVKQAAETYGKAAWLSMTEGAKEHLEYLSGSKFRDAVKPINFEEKESIMATAKKSAAKKSAAKTAAAPKGKPTKVAGPKKEAAAARTPAGPDTRKITLVQKDNPKREGSAAHGIYALYKNGMKVEDFMAAGGTAAALAYDAKKGFITLS